RTMDKPVYLLDCDVEEPNAHLFLPAEISGEEVVNILIPQVDENLCDGCGQCADFCLYNAIAVLGKTPIIFPEMCHACGGCEKVCPQKAISEVAKRIGILEMRRCGDVSLISGRLDIGVAMAPPLIRAVKNSLPADMPVIIDAPPGTSCPVIAAIRDTDMILLVTEPTPFGLNDLALAVDMVRELKIPFGVVVNRMGSGDERVQEFCKKEEVSILLEIPDDRQIAEKYSRGIMMVDALPQYRIFFTRLLTEINSFPKKKEN
ncbi:MAG TPA: ATP-binding protein, partial [Smithellaceae bacterium]|nr:ATP-binding protein [Smithellaceae bacterium]